MRNIATWTAASIACLAILLGGCGRGSSQKPDPILNPPSGGSGSILSNSNLNSGINPDRGPATGGTPVTIVGTGYVPGQTTVTLNGVALSNLAVVNSTTITGETPPLAAGDDPAATLEVQINGAVHENEPGAFGYIQTLTDPSPTAGDHLGSGALTVSPNNGTSSNLPGVPVAVADLDANGTPDLAIGAPEKTISGASSAGQVLVFLSDSSGQLPSTPSVVLTQESDALLMSPEAGARFGFSLAIGDINGDTALDIIVGAPEATGELLGFNVTGAGEVFAFLGDGTGNFFDFGVDGIADALPLGLLVPGPQLGNSEMIDVDEALGVVLEHAAPLAEETVPLLDALGRALREEVRADRDLPPFTRSAMDGFAVRSAEVAGAPVELPIAFEVAAGASPGAVLETGQAARILTGAPLPEGADAVVMVERTQTSADGERVRILQPAVARQNVIDRASDAAAGDVVVEAGTVLTPGGVGVAASVGRARVAVPRRPRAAFLSTGDEIVPVEAEPAPGQIRNSNANVAAAQLALAGAVLETSRIVPDTLEGTRADIAAVLDHDLVILSGGVSVGRYDFVPRALQEEGVEIRFHKVALKPGKPVLFGTRGQTLVFGLPGNPVSSLVTFLLFVAPAIRRMLGHPDPAPRRGRARLAAGPVRRRDRAQFLPATLSRDADGRLTVEPIGWHGSGHLGAMVSSTGLLVVPIGEGQLEVGAEVEVVMDDRQLGGRF